MTDRPNADDNLARAHRAEAEANELRAALVALIAASNRALDAAEKIGPDSSQEAKELRDAVAKAVNERALV